VYFLFVLISLVLISGDISGFVAQFSFTLTRRDDPLYAAWHFKCDTTQELDGWVKALKTVARGSFEQIDV
jgi:hypothetical protein